MLIIVAALVLGAIGVGWLLYRSADNTEGQLTAATGSVLDECAKNDAFAREARARGLCVVAQQAAQTPSATDVGLTPAEITALVNKALDDRGLAGNLTVEQVRTIVRATLPDLTAQQIESAVAAYVAANQERLKGEKGETGEAGKPGTPGRGISSGPRPLRNSAGECELVTSFTDGTVSRTPAGDAACPGGTATTTTTTTTTTPAPNPTTTPTTTTTTTTTTATTTTDGGGLLDGLLGGN